MLARTEQIGRRAGVSLTGFTEVANGGALRVRARGAVAGRGLTLSGNAQTGETLDREHGGAAHVEPGAAFARTNCTLVNNDATGEPLSVDDSTGAIEVNGAVQMAYNVETNLVALTAAVQPGTLPADGAPWLAAERAVRAAAQFHALSVSWSVSWSVLCVQLTRSRVP